VKAPTKGTPFSVAIGKLASAVLVPTAPTRAKILSSSISLFVTSIDLRGS
jgi:hypothetical protein